MAARLTDLQKKKIIADYVECGSYNAVAKKYGISDKTVKSVVEANSEFTKKSEQKKEETTKSILDHMESKRDVVNEIISKGLDVLNDPKKLREASPNQITTALGTLIDKWVMVSGAGGDKAKDDGLSASLKELAKELEDP